MGKFASNRFTPLPKKNYSARLIDVYSSAPIFVSFSRHESKQCFFVDSKTNTSTCIVHRSQSVHFSRDHSYGQDDGYFPGDRFVGIATALALLGPYAVRAQGRVRTRKSRGTARVHRIYTLVETCSRHIFTPLPCLAYICLPETVDLNPATLGMHRNWTFFGRFFLSYTMWCLLQMHMISTRVPQLSLSRTQLRH